MIKKTLYAIAITGVLTGYAFADSFQIAIHDKVNGHPFVDQVEPLMVQSDGSIYSDFDLDRRDNSVIISTNLPESFNDEEVFIDSTGVFVRTHHPNAWSPIGVASFENGKLYFINGSTYPMLMLGAMYRDATIVTAKEKFYDYAGNLVGEFKIKEDKENRKITTSAPETIISDGKEVVNNCVAKKLDNGDIVPFCNFPDGAAKIDITTNAK